MKNEVLDILILGLLVVLFTSIYRKRASARLRYWIIGWAFILLHFAMLLLNPVSNFWMNFDTSIILATLDLGGVAFLLAANRGRMGLKKGFEILALLCAPPLIYIFITQYGVQSKPLWTAAMAVMVVGWLLLITAMLMRSRYNRRRMRGE